MKTLFRVYAALCIISVVMSQVRYPHSSAIFEIIPFPNFKQDCYMGSWNVQGIYNYPDQVNQDFFTTVYTQTSDGNATITESSTNLQNNKHKCIDGQIVFDKPGSGQYRYQYLDTNFYSYITVISTDYSKYTIEWSCTDRDPTESQCYIWIMSRDYFLSPTLEAKINKILHNHNIDTTKIRKIIQDKARCRGGNYWSRLYDMIF